MTGSASTSSEPGTSARLDYAIRPSSSPTPAERRAAILADPGFGQHFTDHMIAVSWTPDSGWHDATLKPYGPFSVDPASAVLHYAQEIFEGLKAYRHDDGSVWTFRPEANGARMRRSAHRMALPQLEVEDFVAALDLLVETDRDWVPSGGEKSLYVRPFMFASEVFLGVRPARHVTFCVIASPAAAYFPGGVKPVSIWLTEEYTRAAIGGTGAAKCGGNYATSLLPQQEAIDNGCSQVAFLDAVDRRWVEELGGMNIYLVYDDGRLVTPELGTILEGVTRDAILTLAKDLGLTIEERQIAIDEWREGVESGRITEAFACGTAAVLTPIGRLAWKGGEIDCAPTGEGGPVTMRIREQLLDIQYGRADDLHGWMHRVC